MQLTQFTDKWNKYYERGHFPWRKHNKNSSFTHLFRSLSHDRSIVSS